LKRAKRVVPVLLDNTPLPPRLKGIHSVNLRGVIEHSVAEPENDRSPLELIIPGASTRGYYDHAAAKRRERDGYGWEPWIVEPNTVLQVFQPFFS
jgi:hypothetical protein